MDDNIHMNKGNHEWGNHEQAMEKAKEMIDKGCGMTEIVAQTHLSEADVIKAKEKWIDQS